MSPLRIAASTSGCSSSSACRRGWVTGVHGGSRSSAKPGTLDDVPQVVEVEQAVDLEDVARLDLERARRAARASRRSCRRSTSTRTTSPKRRRAQLVLDRLQQVVGLVGDREVGVAGDAEDVRGRRSPCPGTARRGASAIRSSSGTNVRPSPTGTKRGSISFGTFTRANVCTSVTGSRTITPSDSERLEM